jgi:hypothetical protein
MTQESSGGISGSSSLRSPEPVPVSAHSGDDPGRVADLELALDLACRTLGDMEPPDSRAVSAEFVSMFSILCGCPNDEARQIIRDAIERHMVKCGETA